MMRLPLSIILSLAFSLAIAALAQSEESYTESIVSNDQATLTVHVVPAILTPVETITITITLDIKPGWYPSSNVDGLVAGESWGGLHIRDIQQLPPTLAPDNYSMRHTWRAHVDPFLPGEESIRMLGVRLFPESPSQGNATILRAEPLDITITSLLAGVDDFVPAALPEPLDREPQATRIPAWVWFVAGVGATACIGIVVFIAHRREDPRLQRARDRQALRAQLALLPEEHIDAEHLREAHRLLSALENLLPNASTLSNQLRDDLHAWHDRYEHAAFDPEPSVHVLATLLTDSASIGQRLHEFASTHREAS